MMLHFSLKGFEFEVFNYTLLQFIVLVRCYFSFDCLAS